MDEALWESLGKGGGSAERRGRHDESRGDWGSHSFLKDSSRISVLAAEGSYSQTPGKYTPVAFTLGEFSFLFMYLIGCVGSSLWHTGSLVVACGIKFLNQGSNLGSPCIESLES